MSKEESKPKHAAEESLAARRAKLRSSLTTQAISINTPASSTNDPELPTSHADDLPLKATNDTQTLELLGQYRSGLIFLCHSFSFATKGSK